MARKAADDPYAGWVPVTCPVCTECLCDPRNGRCMYGGPFKGWRGVAGYKEPPAK